MKIVISPYLSEKLSDFDEIWYTTSDIEPSYSHVTKFLEFKMVATAIFKIAFLAITHRPIADFGEILFAEAERHADKGHMTKTAFFSNPRWRTAEILKIVISPYLSEKSSDFN